MNATVTPLAPAIIPLDLVGASLLEACNTEVGDRHEIVEIGPFNGYRYLRIRTADLLVFARELIRLADDISTSVADERDMKARAEMVECPGCRTRINPDDLACGSDRCYRIAVAEAQL